jgi:Protein of unknown function (DUF2934)
MTDPDQNTYALREAAYFLWEREGRPEGRAQDHWVQALTETSGNRPHRSDDPMEDEEKSPGRTPGRQYARPADEGRARRMTATAGDQPAALVLRMRHGKARPPVGLHPGRR